VLAALRALQDKIRRLECERTQAFDECQQLKSQLKSLEIETEHSKQREMLSSQRHSQESRVAYERLLTEKTELEDRLCKAEERNNKIQLSAEDLQIKIRVLEDEKQVSTLNLRDNESKLKFVEETIERLQQREKGLNCMRLRYIYQILTDYICFHQNFTF
jgi:chromosome segregation ATPase